MNGKKLDPSRKRVQITDPATVRKVMDIMDLYQFLHYNSPDDQYCFDLSQDVIFHIVQSIAIWCPGDKAFRDFLDELNMKLKGRKIFCDKCTPNTCALYKGNKANEAPINLEDLEENMVTSGKYNYHTFSHEEYDRAVEAYTSKHNVAKYAPRFSIASRKKFRSQLIVDSNSQQQIFQAQLAMLLNNQYASPLLPGRDGQPVSLQHPQISRVLSCQLENANLKKVSDSNPLVDNQFNSQDHEMVAEDGTPYFENKDDSGQKPADNKDSGPKPAAKQESQDTDDEEEDEGDEAKFK